MQVVRKSPSGRLFTKGVGIFGALGKGGLNDSKHFEEVAYNGMKNVTSLAAGWGHSAAITVDSEVLIFGRPYDFQSIMRLNSLYGLYKPMGRFVSNLTPKFGGDLSGVFEVPSIVSSSEKVKKCVVSAGLTSMLTESGDVLMFGQNRWGQCAVDNKQSIHVYDPTKVSLPAPVVNVDVGLQHCVAVCSTGHVYSWGKGGKGQLGNGDFESTFNPVLLTDQSLFNAKIKSVSAGFNHSVALSESGVVFVWGKGMSQELKPQKSKLGMSMIFIDIFFLGFCG
jgi:alpha-tubulin suppressor-like RCC1 family protein